MFENFFAPEAIETMRKRGQRSASDIKREAEIAEQDALRSDFTRAAKYFGEDDIPSVEYSLSFQAAMKHTGYSHLTGRSVDETRRLQAAFSSKELEASWQEKRRGF